MGALRRAALVTLVLIASAAAFVVTPVTTYNTTGTVRIVDRVERYVVAVGVRPERFYFSFATTYRVDGEEVTAYRFWRTPMVGRRLQVKATVRRGFWFCTAANLVTKGEAL